MQNIKHGVVSLLAKKLLIVGLLILSICSLASCSNGNNTAMPDDGGAVLERYSINAVEVENTLPTHIMDLSFLADKNQLLIDSLWLDQERLLVLTANPAVEDETDGGTLPQDLYFYILHTGDNSLELIYNGRHMAAGKLQKLSGKLVAVQAYGSIMVLDYNKGKVLREFALDVNSEQTADLVASATGDLMAYSDSQGSIHLLDGYGKEVDLIDPNNFGYNWLSSPIWSKDGDALAFFCGYESFGVDAIGLLAADNLTNPYILNYSKSNDSFPAWPHDKDTILVLNNFHMPVADAASSIEIINWKTNKNISTITMPASVEFASLAYANPGQNIYYLIINSKLFLFDQKNKSLAQMNPGEIQVYEDNVKFSANARRIAVSETDTNGYLKSFCIIGLSPYESQQ